MKMKCKWKNKMKPLISFLLAVLLVLGLTPATLFSVSEVQAVEPPPPDVVEETDGNITWKLTQLDPVPADWDLNKMGKPYQLTLSGTGAMNNYGYSTSPWRAYAPYIYSVEIGDGITSIGNNAFYNCSSLKKVVIPSGVQTIGDSAFSECHLLQEVSGGASLTAIGSNAFSNTYELERVLLAGSRLNSIGSSAFSNAFDESSLSTNTIELPAALTTIGASAFASSKLNSINLSSSNVATIGTSVFSGSSIASIHLPAGLTTIGSSAFSSTENLGSIALPGGVTTIGDSAFLGSAITSITVPAGLTTIRESAFASTWRLGSIALPSSVGTIGDSAFSGSAITSINLPSNMQLTTIGNRVFSDSSLQSITLPNNITSIGSGAFCNCSNLGEVKLNDGLEKIGSSAFASTTNLRSIKLPSSVGTIEDSAFSCSGITSIELPADMPLTTIGNSVFSGSSLQSITLPNNITSIGAYAFYGCSSLGSIEMNDKVGKIGSSAFSKSALVSVDLPNSVTTIGNSAFQSCSGLGTVAFGTGLQTISDSAFQSCSALSTVTFKDNQQRTAEISIGSYAFQFCSALQGISLPDNVKSIRYMAFSASGLTSFHVPKGTTTIEIGILYDCGALNEITVEPENSNFGIFDDALYQMDANGGPDRAIAYPLAKSQSVDTYTITDGAKTLDTYAFAKCGFSGLILSDTVTTLNTRSFENCGYLTSVTFGKSVSSIATGADGAFHNCSNLAEIKTTSEDGNLAAVDNVLYNHDKTVLYMYAFAKKGWEYRVLDTVTTIGKNAIYAVPELEELYLPATLTKLEKGAIYTCGETRSNKLKSIYFAGINAPEKQSDSITGTTSDILLFCVKEAQWDKSAWEREGYEFAEWDPEETFVDEGQTDAREDSEGFTWKYERFNGRLTLEGTEFIPNYEWDSDLPPWNKYMKEIQTIEAGVEQIGDYAFYGANRLRRLSMDSKPTTIGNHAFENCNQLVYITLKNNAAIGDYAFAANTCLKKSLSLNKATSIGAHAFENCSNIPSIDLSSSTIETLGESAFAGCKSMGRITLPSSRSLTSIGKNVFKDCAALRSISLPATITSIGSGAFQGCVALSSIYIPSRVTVIEDYTFDGCVKLGYVNCLTGTTSMELTSIGKNAFNGCSSLTTVVIPESMLSLGSNAFAGNTSLTRVYFKGAYPQNNIADDCFVNGNGSLTLYYILKKDESKRWASYDGDWHGLPLKAQDHFYTEGRDHYNFSNSASSFGYSNDYRIPRQRYVDTLDSIIIGTYYYAINKYWGGSCYGMASTSLEFYENINDRDLFKVQSYNPARSFVYELDRPGSPDNALTQLIETYQVSQYQPQISSCVGEIRKNMNQYNKLIRRITDFQISGGLEIDDNAAPVVITVYSIFGGHALVPVSLNQKGYGSYEVKVYDCNYPDSFQTLMLSQNGFSYKFYNQAISFIDYKTIAAGMAEVQPLEEEAANTLYLSIDKEAGNITDDSGNGIDKIKNGYEQKPFMGNEEDVFSGIKSYVLPKGSYTIAADNGEEADDSETAENTDIKPEDTDSIDKTSEDIENPDEENLAGEIPDGGESDEENPDEPEEDTDSAEDVTFYMAANDLFAEVTASDEDSALSVNTLDTTEDKVEMTLTPSESSAEDDHAAITLMNENGFERVIDVSGCDGEVKVGVSEDETISITAPETASVKIDGNAAETVNGQVSVTFTSTADENPFRISDLAVTANCDEKNKLSADLSANVLNNSSSVQSVELTAEFLDQYNHRVASYSETRKLNPGSEPVSLSPENLNTDFEQIEGEVILFCKFKIKSEDYSISAISDGVTVVLTKQPNEGKPDTGDENDPGNNPGSNEPDDGNNSDDGNNPDDGSNLPDDGGNPDDGSNPPDDGGNPDDGSNPPDDGSNSDDGNDSDDGSNMPDDGNNSGDGNDKYDSDKTEEINKPNNGIGSGSGTDQTVIADTNINPLVKAVESISATPNKIKIGVGESYKLAITVTPADAANQTLVYTASNKNVTVDKEGTVVGKKAGNSWVIVSSDNGKTVRAKVEVKKAPKHFKLNAATKRLKKGRTFQIKVKLPKKTASHKMTFTSNKKSVATVSDTGKVTALKKGTAVITVKTFNGKKAKLKVRVK